MSQEPSSQQDQSGCSGCSGCGTGILWTGVGCTIVVLVLIILGLVGLLSFKSSWPTLEINGTKTTWSGIIDQVPDSIQEIIPNNHFIPTDIASPVSSQQISKMVSQNGTTIESTASLNLLKVNNKEKFNTYFKQLEQGEISNVTLTKNIQFKSWKDLPRSADFIKSMPSATSLMKNGNSIWTVKWESNNESGQTQKWMGYMALSRDSDYIYLDYAEERQALILYPEAFKGIVSTLSMH